MEVISRSSSLNPNAPLFVPLAYQAVEDYSDDWWALIQSSTWFRDYWLRECFQDPQNIPNFSEFDDVMLQDDVDSLFHDSIITNNSEEEKEMEMEKEGKSKEIVTLGSLKWTKRRGCASAMNREKAPKIVNVKVSPRPIQQPR